MSATSMLLAGLAASAAAPFLAALSKRFGGAVCVAVPAAMFAYFFSQIGAVGVAPVVETVSWVPALGVDLTIRLDGFSLLFALLISGIGTLVTLYAAGYMDEKPDFTRAQFLLYILLFMMAMLATVTADNLIAMFVFWEMTSLLSFLLVGFDSKKAEAREAALQSLVVTVGGGLALLAGVILIGVGAGTFSISALLADSSALVASPLFGPAIVLVMIGCFTKSAQVPFHFWLPNAMAAPTPASAYLHSATMVKLGVFLLAKLSPIFTQAEWFGPTLVAFGCATMLVAAVQALRSTAFKAVLAFSTVASLGTITMLIGLDGEVAAVSVVGFITAHALYKAALFFCAGIVIHATGQPELDKLGGLGAKMPVTRVAIILAALSAAGLPPFVGFIAKEYLFEGQLESSFTLATVAVAVLVNAVMVAVAAIVVLRPFFRPAPADLHVHHGETPGMYVGPLVLGVAGLVFGLAPWLIAGPLLAPAAAAVNGAPLYVSFSLWHGFTPMLALSAVVVALGVLVTLKWDAIHSALKPSVALERLLGDGGYQATMRGLVALSAWATPRFQNGDPRFYAAVTASAVTALVFYGLLSGDGPLLPAPPEEPFSFFVVTAVALIVVGCVSAAIAQSVVTAIIGAGLGGFGLALIFLFNGGPDLALTQFSVETLFVVIVTAVLMRLPLQLRVTRGRGERTFDIALALAFAGMVFVCMLWISAAPFNAALPEYFAQVSYPEAQGRNVVNVIIVDFRGLDTLGEIAVVTFAAIGAWALLRGGERRRAVASRTDGAARKTSRPVAAPPVAAPQES